MGLAQLWGRESSYNYEYHCPSILEILNDATDCKLCHVEIVIWLMQLSDTNDEPGIMHDQTMFPTQRNTQARASNNTLYALGPHNERCLAVPEYSYSPFSPSELEARLLTVHPSTDTAAHLRCTITTHLLTDLPPFIAVKNARGYRNFEEAIEVDGHALRIAAALERFFRWLRTQYDVPVKVWVRYVCVQQFNVDEQSRYWTRDFSDTMYGRATQVLDMHAINNQLVASGYFERIGDGRFQNHAKNMHVGSSIVLPRVCPVRLGIKASLDNPTEEYEYLPLDMMCDELRVMNIMPAKNLDDPIVIHAAHCPMRCEVTFAALSCKADRSLQLFDCMY